LTSTMIFAYFAPPPMLAARATREEGSGELAELLPELRAVLTVFRIPVQDVEDVLQDVLLIYLAKRCEVRTPQAWLNAVMRHRCRQYWDASRRRAEQPLDPETFLGQHRSTPRSTLEERIDCQAALRRLPPRGRNVIALRYWGGFNQREIAERTGFAIASVDKTGRRMLALLRRRLSGTRT